MEAVGGMKCVEESGSSLKSMMKVPAFLVSIPEVLSMGLSKYSSSILKELWFLTKECWVLSARKTSISYCPQKNDRVGVAAGSGGNSGRKQKTQSCFKIQVLFHFRKISKNSNRKGEG